MSFGDKWSLNDRGSWGNKGSLGCSVGSIAVISLVELTDMGLTEEEVVEMGMAVADREGGGTNGSGGVVENNRTYSTKELMPT